MLAVHYMPNTLGHARLGLVVAKKIAKHAVQRNYMKRTLRELFRHEKFSLRPVDILIRPLKSYSRGEYLTVQSELTLLLNKLRMRSST